VYEEKGAIMKKGLALLSLLSITVLGAGEAHALRAYTPAADHACTSCRSCSNPAQVARVGAFDLAGISGDHRSGSSCALGSSQCKHGAGCPFFSEANPIIGAAGLVVKPVIAVLNDAHLLITMPYRKAEPLN
jgi:hypothetical protein